LTGTQRAKAKEDAEEDAQCHGIRNPLNGILNNVDLLQVSLEKRKAHKAACKRWSRTPASAVPSLTEGAGAGVAAGVGAASTAMGGSGADVATVSTAGTSMAAAAVMDGIEATRRLRERGATVPIIGLSGNSRQEQVDEAMVAGMNA